MNKRKIFLFFLLINLLSLLEAAAYENIYDKELRYDGYTIKTGNGNKIIYDEASRQRGYIYSNEKQKDSYEYKNKSRYSNGDSGYSGNNGRSY